MKPTIADEIRSELRVQGAELTIDDVGRTFGYFFGRVLDVDVGKRVWLRPFGITMENATQRNSRKGTS